MNDIERTGLTVVIAMLVGIIAEQTNDQQFTSSVSPVVKEELGIVLLPAKIWPKVRKTYIKVFSIS